MLTRVWTLRHWTGTFDIELALTRSSGVELEETNRTLFTLRAEYQNGVPEVQSLVDEIHRVLSGAIGPKSATERKSGGRGSDEMFRSFERAARSGQLIIREKRSVAVARRADSLPVASGLAPLEAAPPTFFHARFVDEVGDPIDSLAVVLTAEGKANSLTTDGSGKVRLDGVHASFATTRAASAEGLRNALRPRWDTARGRPLLEATEDTVVWRLSDALPSLELEDQKLRTVSVRPFVVRARLVGGGFFDTSKNFLLPSGVESIRRVVSMQQPGTALLVVGHTDTAGKPAYNDPLSLERADAVVAYLRGDVAAWFAFYDASVASEKRWGKREDLAMIDALPDASERDATETPVAWFQRTRGLKIDGVAGSETRHSLIRDYMALEGTSLGADVPVTSHGCGENFPAEATGDEKDEPENRRVDIFFFDRKLGIQPKPAQKNSKAGSLEYPEWLARSGKPVDFSTDDDIVELSIEWPEDLVASLPEDSAVILSGEDVESEKHFLAMAQRDSGVVRVTFGELDSTARLTLTAKSGNQEVVLFRDQPVSDLDNPLVWEHELSELLQPDALDDEELVANGGLPDDVEFELVGFRSLEA